MHRFHAFKPVVAQTRLYFTDSKVTLYLYVVFEMVWYIGKMYLTAKTSKASQVTVVFEM